MFKHLLRIALSCLLLVYFFLNVDWTVLISALYKINIYFYLVSTIVALSGSYFMARKYHLLIKGTPLSISVVRLMVIHFISRFYALFLPTALGPEFVRWYKVTKDKSGKTFFLAATSYERMLFLLVLFIFGMLPLIFYEQHEQIIALRESIWPFALGIGSILILGLIYILNARFQIFIKNLLKNIFRVKQTGRIHQFLDNLTIGDNSINLLISLLVLTLCWQVFFIFRIFFLFKSMGLGLGLVESAWMGSLVLLLQILPVSFAGLGVREGAYAYLFSIYGLPAEKGLLIGMLFFTQMLVFATIGALLNMLET